MQHISLLSVQHVLTALSVLNVLSLLLSLLFHRNLALNNILGSLPEDWAHLTDLVELQLKHNQISGSIPPRLANLKQLTVLDLDNNNVTGSIPAELADLRQLATIDLSSNELSGSIHPAFADLNQLKYFNVKDNKLTGVVPDLPFEQYTRSCQLQNPVSPSNSFACPLPRVRVALCVCDAHSNTWYSNMSVCNCRTGIQVVQGRPAQLH
jgi:Leucine-rich repeat (LRR) protein